MSEFSSLYIKTRVVTFCVVTFRVKEVVTFCVEKLLQFRPMLHFASKVVTFCVNVTLTSLARHVSVLPTYLGHFLKFLLVDILN